MGRKIKKEELPARSGKNAAECPTYLDSVHLNALTGTGQTKLKLQAEIPFCRLSMVFDYMYYDKWKISYANEQS